MKRSFESNLFKELVDPVHKTSLNDMFMNQTDPFLKFNSLTLENNQYIIQNISYRVPHTRKKDFERRFIFG